MIRMVISLAMLLSAGLVMVSEGHITNNADDVIWNASWQGRGRRAEHPGLL